jgi:hypothetical protein
MITGKEGLWLAERRLIGRIGWLSKKWDFGGFVKYLKGFLHFLHFPTFLIAGKEVLIGRMGGWQKSGILEVL